MMNAVELKYVVSKKTGQGQTTLKPEEDINSTQKLSGLHFLNNSDLKGPQKDDSCPTKAGHISWHSELGTKYLKAYPLFFIVFQ